MIDIGLNLTSSQFDADRPAILTRAYAAGVQGALLTGTSAENSQRALELLSPPVKGLTMRSTAGVHPHAAKTWNVATATSIERLLTHPHVVAVGECGLDYDRMASTVEQQRVAFEAQLDLALRHNKPAFLHLRPGPEGHDQALQHFEAMVRPRVKEGLRGVVHCFTANEETLNTVLGFGFYIGITGWVCDERRGGELQRLLPGIPDDRLMVETDAPYLLPRSMPNARKMRRNEPAFLPFVVQAVSTLRDQPVDAVVAITTANVRRCFNWPAEL